MLGILVAACAVIVAVFLLCLGLEIIDRNFYRA